MFRNFRAATTVFAFYSQLKKKIKDGSCEHTGIVGWPFAHSCGQWLVTLYKGFLSLGFSHSFISTHTVYSVLCPCMYACVQQEQTKFDNLRRGFQRID